MNVIQFIKKHQNETFNELPLTEVDSLILSLLPYINFNGTINSLRRKAKTLKEVARDLKNKNIQTTSFITNTYKMFQIMAGTKRYQDILLYNYLNIVNDEMQFQALTIKLPTKTVFVAYAGTDTSIIGWHEDFKMAYMYPGISQKYAVNYFNKTISIFDRNVLIGGHSKGGNLAICAAMNTRFYLRKRIKAIYNFDGPGFLKGQIESKEYKNIEPLIRMYVPKDSIIGMLLYHADNYQVVKAKSFGLLEHDAFNWECNASGFIQDKQTNRSINLEKKIIKKLEELSIEQRIQIVDRLFLIFKNRNIKDTKDIKIKEIFNLLKDFQNLDKETKNWIVELLLILFIK